jgi:hypothetical protein
VSPRWFSGLHGSARDRVARARLHLENGRPDLARAEVLDLREAEAMVVRLLAERGLALRHLDEAVAAARAGDDARAADRLAAAEALDPKGRTAAFAEARRAIRAIQATRAEVGERTLAERRARLVSADPLGLAGPSFSQVAAPLEVEPSAAEVQAGLGAVAATWPESMVARAATLGLAFARAVLDLEEGRPEDALRALLFLPDDDPLVCWERARASEALGDDEGAARLVRTFARLLGRHVRMGKTHSGVWLAELTARAGDPFAALRTLRDVRATEPGEADALFAELLRRTGQKASSTPTTPSG